MDINQDDWPYALKDMLAALSTAHFVSIDLELSGMSTKTTRPKEESSARKQTLQQRYEELRLAAESYQVLQMGLTVVKEDVERGLYTLRPYNMYINPVLKERLQIDRMFSFQSSCVDFLLTHGFSMEGPFLKGLPYLSREEEHVAVEGEKTRLDRNAILDIELRKDEVESIEFVQRMRQKIEGWLKLRDRPDFLHITPDTYQLGGEMPRGFNNYQRRLIHQLLRAEHPELMLIPQPGFIQIKFIDQEQEDKIMKAKLDSFQERVRKQIGIRWLVEAMVGGSLKRIDPTTMIRPDNHGKMGWFNKGKIVEEFEALRHHVERHHMVLVGHNMFMDLVNFYRCFLGTLPKSLQEFKRKIRALFPFIIDTKYLATHFNKSGDRSQLEQLDGDLAGMSVPVLECHLHHQRYLNTRPAHEAGFDSYMTARVLIRLSAKLEATGYYTEDLVQLDSGSGSSHHRSGSRSSHSREKDGTPSDTPKILSPRPTKPGLVDFDLLAPVEDLDAAVLQAVKVPRTSLREIKRQNAAAKKALLDISNEPSRKSSHGLRELFEGNQAAAAQINTIKATHSKQPATLFNQTSDLKEGRHSRRIRGTFIDQRPKAKDGSRPRAVDIPTFMPHFGNDFWRVYGNKLRVGGTEEEVLDLNERGDLLS